MNEPYVSSPVGTEIRCTFYGIPEKGLLESGEFVGGEDFPGYITRTFRRISFEAILLRALREDGFTILKSMSTKFEPRGYSCAIQLAESDITVHTYPEHDSFVVKLYTCRRPFDGRRTIASLMRQLRPSIVELKESAVIVKEGNADDYEFKLSIDYKNGKFKRKN